MYDTTITIHRAACPNCRSESLKHEGTDRMESDGSQTSRKQCHECGLKFKIVSEPFPAGEFEPSALDTFGASLASVVHLGNLLSLEASTVVEMLATLDIKPVLSINGCELYDLESLPRLRAHQAWRSKREHR